MTPTDTPKVYNLRDKNRVAIPRDAVYVGRGTPYGNPFIAGLHGSRETVIRKFVEQVLPDLDVSALRGKDLICWCDPLPCHGHAILAKANAPVEYLPEGLWERDGVLYFECKACGNESEWYGEPEEFELDNYTNMCGGSPRCCP